MRNKLIIGIKHESVYEFIIIYVFAGLPSFLWAGICSMFNEELNRIYVPFLLDSGINCVVLPIYMRHYQCLGLIN